MGLLGLYSVGHFAVDFLCALLVFGRFAGGADWMEAALIYNFCAFALQMPIGVLVDRIERSRILSAVGAGLVCLAVIPLGFWWTVLLAGIGNACYHVGGGRETLLTSWGYGSLGIFVAPGAVGVYLGGLLRGSRAALVCAVVLMALCGTALAIASRDEAIFPSRSRKPGFKPLGFAALLFVIVLLRSLVGMCSLSPWKVGVWIPIGAVLGAAGKALGGFAADRLGGRWAGVISLLPAAVLFLFPNEALCGAAAGLLFNMSMPITLRDSADRIPGGEGFVFGLMTFALFLGFLPAQLGISLTAVQTAGLSGISGLLLVFAAKGR